MNEFKNKEPLVSVIIPTYNHAQFIGEAITSVLKQSYENIELIIVDNYSQDGTQSVVEEFSDSRIKYFKFRNYGIISASKNFGIEKSKGKFIAFLDSDDIWLPDKLKFQVEKLVSDRDMGLVFCAFKIMSPNTEYNNKIIVPKKGNISGYVYEKLLNFNFITASSVMIKASIIDTVGMFDEGAQLRRSEDYELWLRIARKYKIAFIPEVGGIYRRHDFNESTDGRVLERANYIIDEYLRKGWVSPIVARRARANYYLREGYSLVGSNSRQARRLFYQALRSNWFNPKMFMGSIVAMFISFFPVLIRVMNASFFERKVLRRIFNHQNI